MEQWMHGIFQQLEGETGVLWETQEHCSNNLSGYFRAPALTWNQKYLSQAAVSGMAAIGAGLQWRAAAWTMNPAWRVCAHSSTSASAAETGIKGSK